MYQQTKCRSEPKVLGLQADCALQMTLVVLVAFSFAAGLEAGWELPQNHLGQSVPWKFEGNPSAPFVADIQSLNQLFNYTIHSYMHLILYIYMCVFLKIFFGREVNFTSKIWINCMCCWSQFQSLRPNHVLRWQMPMQTRALCRGWSSFFRCKPAWMYGSDMCIST